MKSVTRLTAVTYRLTAPGTTALTTKTSVGRIEDGDEDGNAL